jgi:hypothetical protein
MDGHNDSRVHNRGSAHTTEQCVAKQKASTLKKLFQQFAELGRCNTSRCPHAYLSFASRTTCRRHPTHQRPRQSPFFSRLAISLTVDIRVRGGGNAWPCDGSLAHPSLSLRAVP